MNPGTTCTGIIFANAIHFALGRERGGHLEVEDEYETKRVAKRRPRYERLADKRARRK